MSVYRFLPLHGNNLTAAKREIKQFFTLVCNGVSIYVSVTVILTVLVAFVYLIICFFE